MAIELTVVDGIMIGLELGERLIPVIADIVRDITGEPVSEERVRRALEDRRSAVARFNEAADEAEARNESDQQAR